MEEFDFTEEEIRENLQKLGYANVPESRLKEFKRELVRLVQSQRSQSSASSVCDDAGSTQGNDDRRGPLDGAGNRRDLFDNINGAHPDNRGKENFMYGHQSEAYLHQPTRVDDQDFSLYSEPDPPRERRERLPSEVVSDVHNTSTTSMDTTTSTERKTVKRKTLRKKDGHSHIDESVTESETDQEDLATLQDRLRELPLRDYPRPHTAPHYARPYSAGGNRPQSGSQSARDEPVYRLPIDFNGPTALIKPMSKDPHTKNVKKSDPVSQYNKYRQSWTSQRAPGEKTHKNLRWNVREHMLYHDIVVEKKSKSYVPNSYVIPSDKKRKNLRWQIRNDLATGVKPPSMYD